MTTQLAIRVRDELLEQIDELVRRGTYSNRTEFMRIAFEDLVDRERRRRIDEQYVEAYTRMPQTDDEVAWAEADALRMIAEEPW
jgi:Arc/MetJ-type ribon-helix-helix transcriptional regulator